MEDSNITMPFTLKVITCLDQACIKRRVVVGGTLFKHSFSPSFIFTNRAQGVIQLRLISDDNVFWDKILMIRVEGLECFNSRRVFVTSLLQCISLVGLVLNINIAPRSVFRRGSCWDNSPQV